MKQIKIIIAVAVVVAAVFVIPNFWWFIETDQELKKEVIGNWVQFVAGEEFAKVELKPNGRYVHISDIYGERKGVYIPSNGLWRSKGLIMLLGNNGLAIFQELGKFEGDDRDTLTEFTGDKTVRVK